MVKCGDQGAIEIPTNTTLTQEVFGLYDKKKVLPDRKHVIAAVAASVVK